MLIYIVKKDMNIERIYNMKLTIKVKSKVLQTKQPVRYFKPVRKDTKLFELIYLNVYFNTWW